MGESFIEQLKEALSRGESTALEGALYLCAHIALVRSLSDVCYFRLHSKVKLTYVSLFQLLFPVVSEVSGNFKDARRKRYLKLSNMSKRAWLTFSSSDHLKVDYFISNTNFGVLFLIPHIDYTPQITDLSSRLHDGDLFCWCYLLLTPIKVLRATKDYHQKWHIPPTHIPLDHFQSFHLDLFFLYRANDYLETITFCFRAGRQPSKGPATSRNVFLLKLVASVQHSWTVLSCRLKTHV